MNYLVNTLNRCVCVRARILPQQKLFVRTGTTHTNFTFIRMQQKENTLYVIVGIVHDVH